MSPSPVRIYFGKRKIFGVHTSKQQLKNCVDHSSFFLSLLKEMSHLYSNSVNVKIGLEGF